MTSINWITDYNLTPIEMRDADDVFTKMHKRLTEEKLAEFNPEIIHNSAIEATLKYFETVRKINQQMADEYYTPRIKKYLDAKNKMLEAWMKSEWGDDAQKALEYLDGNQYSLGGLNFSKYPTLEHYRIEDGHKMFGKFELPKDGKLFATDPCYVNARKDRTSISDISWLGCRIDVASFLNNGYQHLEAWATVEGNIREYIKEKMRITSWEFSQQYYGSF